MIEIKGQPVDAPNQDPVLLRKRCEALIIAMVGKVLARQWWNNPNRAFDGKTPEQMYSVEPTKVYAYLMSRSEGEW